MENEIIKLPKKRKRLSIVREGMLLEELNTRLPDDEVQKYVSHGGFSAIAFIIFVAQRTPINELVVSSLRVGKKHLQTLNRLHEDGVLKKAAFIVGGVMKNDSELGKSYQYYEALTRSCAENGWEVIVRNNHSKILLIDTDAGKYVVETSSNLNENPNMEQFSFEKDERLFDFYKKFLLE